MTGEAMNPKRVVIVTGAVLALTLVVTSYAEVVWDSWWVNVGGAALRGIPLGLFVASIVVWKHPVLAARFRRRAEVEVDDIEQRRRDFQRHQPELYEYVTHTECARVLDNAADLTNSIHHQTATRLWRMAGFHRAKAGRARGERGS
jgi:hypothetical protein